MVDCRRPYGRLFCNEGDYMKNLDVLRKKINETDAKMRDLFLERMEAADATPVPATPSPAAPSPTPAP